jgi:anti-sigma regulatory factor (Ser/Thr protein kinase)
MSPGDLAQKARPRRGHRPVNSTEVRLRLPSGPGAVAAARHGLDGLESEVGSERLHNVRLLVSELVTNSVRHAHNGDGDGEQLELEVSVSRQKIHVCVTDSGPGFEAAARSADDDPGSGWGLFLVEQLSDRWGVELNGSTQVWFEIER